MEYLQLYPETISAVRRYPPEDRCALYEAMAAYAFGGDLPDWPEDDLKWLIWESLRQRVEAAIRAREAKAAAGAKGGKSSKPTEVGNNPETSGKAKQTEADGSKGKQTEADGSRAKQTEADGSIESESESESDFEAEPEAEPENGHTHDIPVQQSAQARAREAWFDPNRPRRRHDSAWRSERARPAIAQRIADTAYGQLAHRTSVPAEGTVFGADLFPAICDALKAGIPPDACVALLSSCDTTWRYELGLKALAIQYGIDPPLEWHEQVSAYEVGEVPQLPRIEEAVACN